MTDKAESKDVTKEGTAEEKPADGAVKTEIKAEGEEGDKDETKGEGDEEAEKVEEPKVFKYKHTNHATAEEHESSPYMWIRTKTLTQAINQDADKTQNALKEVFAEKFGVEVPKIKLPLLMQLYVEMRSLEDKLKVLTDSHRPYPKKPGTNRAPPDVVTQTVVVRGEVYEEAKRGTLAEALEELLPHRNTSYKDQLTLKAKELDETFDELLKDCNESIAKDRKYQNPTPIEKPVIDSIVPLVPNVGYDRNVFIDLEKDTKGKITAGIRVHYEKDEVKKVFLVPVSECVHIAPPIVKAAEAVAAHLSSEKVPVFGPKTNSSGCLFGLKFAMNDIGEIILSVVLVIDDKFLDEFYDLNVEEDVQRAIDDYYSKLAAGKIKPADDSKVNGEDEEGDEKEEEKGEEGKTAETEKKAEDKKTDEKKDESVKQEEKMEVNGAEPKEEGLVIMRESSTIPIALDKSPFLNRVEDQVKDHLNKYTASLKKFFDGKCEALGISGIYITWRATNKRPTEWNRNVKHWYHVCGSKSVPETVNSIKFELYPHLEGYNPTRTQILPTLMHLLVDNLGIDSNSQVVVACDYFVVQNFFAQKCKKTVMMSFLNEMLRKDIKERSKDSVAFVSAKAKQMNIVDRCKRHFGGDSPHALIHWGHFQDNPVKKLFQHRVKKVGVVFEARERNFSQQNNNSQHEVMKKMNLAMFPMYKLKKVVGVDICPQRTGPVTLVAFYDAVQGHIPFYNNRGMKRRNNFTSGGPNAKRVAGGNRPNQGGMGGRPRNNMNNMPGKRRGGPGGPMGGRGGGGGGGRGGYFPKRQRMDDRRPPPMQQRGGPRNRFNQRGPDRPAPMGGRQPNPWNDQRGDRYNDRGNYNDGQPEHTVQAAKAVLSQLNTIIENQMILAQMGQTPNRPEDDWVRPPARDSFGSAPRGGGGLPAYGNEPAGFFARDVSPPSSIGGYRQNDYGGGRNRDFGGGRMGGGGAGGNRRGGGGGGGNKGFRRRN